jgi:maleamate amidohydrolase
VTADVRPWDALVPASELAELAAAGFGAPQGIGDRPCLIVIDVVLSFLGPRPGSGDAPSAMGCGDMGWEALPRIVELVDRYRAAGIPVMFTKGDLQDKIFCGGSVKRTSGAGAARSAHDTWFPDELVPGPDEYVLSKPKASAFFGTPLMSYLTRNRIDSVVLAGTTTSGCVRATAVDASSHNLKVVVAHDACFDRSAFAHAANLFDIQMKYGDVVTARDAAELVAGAPAQPADCR